MILTILLLCGAFPCADCLLTGLIVEPVCGNGLGSCEEANAVSAQNVQIAEEGILVAGEREVSARYRDTNVNANHAAVCIHDELS